MIVAQGMVSLFDCGARSPHQSVCKNEKDFTSLDNYDLPRQHVRLRHLRDFGGLPKEQEVLLQEVHNLHPPPHPKNQRLEFQVPVSSRSMAGKSWTSECGSDHSIDTELKKHYQTEG